MHADFSLDQLRAMFSVMPDPVFILTRSGRYSAVFGGTDLRYYHDGSSLVGVRIGDVIAEEKARWFLEQIDTTLRARQLHIVEYTLSGSDVKGLSQEGPSTPIWFEGRIQALPFQADGEDAVLWVSSNITARKELEEKLRSLSETDPLTGLYNRRKLMEAREKQFQFFLRFNSPTSELVFDIDHFKHVNDEQGHLVGDQAIMVVADACRCELRSTDIISRLGGDEFVVLMPQTTLNQAVPIAERLGLSIAERLQKLLKIDSPCGTISGGLSQFLKGDVGGEEMFARADAALYQAKRSGRNRIVQYEGA